MLDLAAAHRCFFSRGGSWAPESGSSAVTACGSRSPVACGILVLRPGIKPLSAATEGGFPATGSPGKSPRLFFYLPK